MTKFLLFFLLGCSSCQMALCDDQLLAGQKITYLRDVPSNVARSLPRKNKRLFWGTWTPQVRTPMMGVQLYKSRNSLTLEFWQKKQQNFLRINRLIGLYQDDLSPGAKFGVDFYWLDGTRNTTPILVLTKITYGDENLLPGEYRVIEVMSFASGWKSKPKIQTFYDGNSNAGASGFGLKRSEKGMLELSIFSVGNTDNGYGVTNTYDWDGGQFSLVPEKREKHEPPPD